MDSTLKRRLDEEDCFRDKAAVQTKIPFQMDFLRRLILKRCLGAEDWFRLKFHFKWTFKNGSQL